MRVVFAAMLVFGLLQDGKAPAPPVADRSYKLAEPAPKKASAEHQVVILKLQLQQAKLKFDYDACQATVQRIPGEFNALGAQIEQEKAKALGDEKLKAEEWDLNIDTWEFVKKPPKEEPKKP